MNDEELINQVYRKIEREKVIINAANAMRASSNPQVQQSLDSQVREARKGIEYLEERMRELQKRRMESMSSGSNGGPPTPVHGGMSPRQMQNTGYGKGGAPPTPPPKDQEAADYGDPSNGGYMNDMSGGNVIMPPRAPFGPPGPGSAVPKSRPNYTKLGTVSQGRPREGANPHFQTSSNTTLRI